MQQIPTVMLSPHPTLRLADVVGPGRTDMNSFWRAAATRYTYNARGALYQLCRMLPYGKGQEVLLPAFHCTTVVDPFVRAGYRVRFYRVTPSLSIDYADVSEKLTRNVALILVINFFGFPADIAPLLELRRRHDCIVVEDWAHSFVSAKLTRAGGSRGDFAVFSFYKVVPSQAGGALCSSAECFSSQLMATRIGLGQTVVIFKRMLEEVIENASSDAIVKRVFRYVERTRVALKGRVSLGASVNDEQYLFDEKLALSGIPWLSREVVRRADLDSVMAARRRNYCSIDKCLRENGAIRKVYRGLQDDVCPWAYPVLVANRAEHDRTLREAGVPIFTFGETLHPRVYDRKDRAFEDAEYLSKSLMMIPVHQNLTEAELGECCDKINVRSPLWLQDLRVRT